MIKIGGDGLGKDATFGVTNECYRHGSGPDNSNRLVLIDILRGAAALAVFIFHVSGAANFPKLTLPPVQIFGHVFANIPSLFTLGATGVSLFFVISGFCLALQPLRRQAKKIELGSYIQTRIARIYPAYAVATLFSAIVATLQGVDLKPAILISTLVFAQGVSQDYYFFPYNGALWSMATEVQFYVVFPLAFLLLIRGNKGVVFAIILACVVAFRIGTTYLPGAEVMQGGIVFKTFLMNQLPGRFLEFSSGMMLAWAFERRRTELRWASGIAVLPLIVFGLWARGWGPNWLADPAMALMYAAIIGVLITSDSLRESHSRRMTFQVAAAFGRSSYSFFLVHVPIISVATVVVARTLGGDAMTPYTLLGTITVLSFALSLPIAIALYQCVEIPLWKRFAAKSSLSPR